MTLLCHKNITRFEIAMNDALPVRVPHRIADLGQNSRRFVGRKTTPANFQQIIERLGVASVGRDEIHNDVEHAVILVQVVDLHDVRMLERGHHMRLARELLAKLGRTSQRRRQNLHRVFHAHYLVLGQPHLAHRPRAQAADHAIISQTIH
ncbi:MAG: hypothetical protein NTY46_16765 [Candidatus Sumerlaeota bacterium]|nr:hypothetical protein [Candidatus Sumerlaeota bacterium]